MDTEELMTVEEVADRLKVIPITIRRWIARGEMTGIKTPAGWRFEEKDIQAWIDAHRTPAKVADSTPQVDK